MVTASDSAAPSGWLVSVIVAEARLALSGSVMSAFGATLAAGESSVKLAVASEPPPPLPFRSVAGASLTAVTEMVLVAAFESTVPSFALNSTVFEAEGLSPEWEYVTDRSAAWKSDFDAGPVSVSTPVPESYECVIPDASTKSSTSPDWNPVLIRMRADSRFVSSTSVTVSDPSIAVAGSASVYAVEPLLVVTTG